MTDTSIFMIGFCVGCVVSLGMLYIVIRFIKWMLVTLDPENIAATFSDKVVNKQTS